MLQEAIDLQNDAVEKLINLTLNSEKKEITFKAPTGSGKTHMMADMMNRILERDNNVVFFVSALSKGNLAKQNYDKFNEYEMSGDFSRLNPYLISSEKSKEERLYIPTDYNVYILPRDLYKKNGKLMQGPMIAFLQSLTDDTWFGGKGKKIYLIKDESHIATNNLDELSNYFDIVYNFSATPKLLRGQRPNVEISDESAVNAKLIKKIQLDEDPSSRLQDALNKFVEIKTKYRDHIGVNPCLIIQISNKNKEEEELNSIYSELNKSSFKDLKWMTIVKDESDCDTNDNFRAKKLPVSKWKDYAKESLSTIDIIIFKMIITEGWDIPRACMLYQIRNSKSKQLDEQVMGRVRRNPRLKDFEKLSKNDQQLALTSWIWGIAPQKKRKSFSVKLDTNSKMITDEVRIKTTRLKSLKQKKDFDIERFIAKQPEITSPTNIFDLYRNYKEAEKTIQNLCDNYSESYHKWNDFTENLQIISHESNQYICDYDQSMEVTRNSDTDEVMEFSFPAESYFTETNFYININDWVWKRTDSKEKYSFDSEAEREWANILKDLSKDDNYEDKRVTKRLRLGEENPHANEKDLFGNKEPQFINNEYKKRYMWGKNYLPNSQIKFQYYLGAIHSSYPDFIMKDSFNRIHIFEIKSVNISENMDIDNNIYQKKVNELKKAYHQASKITDNIYYLPIQNKDDWTIFQYNNGDENILSESQFEEFCKHK